MNIAIITAGGVGARMGNNVPKQFIEVNGRPIIAYTLDAFDSHPQIDAIIVVCLKSWMDYLEQYVARHRYTKLVKIVEGGEEGQQSIYNGLCEAEQYVESLPDENLNDTIVLINDGVRPLISRSLIANNIHDTMLYGNSITVVSPTETFIVAENNKRRLLSRDDVHIVRAPQCFRLNDILQLYCRAIADGLFTFRDCCSMLCHYDIPFHETFGDTANIKITYPSDVILFRSLIEYKEMRQALGL